MTTMKGVLVRTVAHGAQVLRRGLCAGGTALVTPSATFSQLTAPVACAVLATALAVQSAAIVSVAVSRPAFLVSAIEAELTRSGDEASRARVDSVLRQRAGKFVVERIGRTLSDTVVLWAFCISFVCATGKGRNVADRLIALPCLGLALALSTYHSSYSHTFLSNAGFLTVIAAIALVFWRRRRPEFVQTFLAVAMAAMIPAIGFVVRQIVTLMAGRDPGHATLQLLFGWSHTASHWLGRLDVFGLWWPFVLAAGLAVVTKRSYWSTAATTGGANFAASVGGLQRYLG